jgi:hypothetical protein
LGNGTSALQVVAPGTSGNVLTSNGTTWQSTAPAASGGLTLLATTTPTGSTSSVSVTGLAAYKQLILIASSVGVSVSTFVAFALSSDNGSTYGSAASLTNSGSTARDGIASLFRTSTSSSTKPYSLVTTTTSLAATYSATTGIIDAVRFSTGSGTFNGTGVFLIYGVN